MKLLYRVPDQKVVLNRSGQTTNNYFYNYYFTNIKIQIQHSISISYEKRSSIQNGTEVKYYQQNVL